MIELDGIPYNLIAEQEYMNNLREAGFKDVAFEDTSSKTVELSEKDCKKIQTKKSEIEEKFGKATYDESLTSWTAQYNLFKNKELQTGIFRATK